VKPVNTPVALRKTGRAISIASGLAAWVAVMAGACTPAIAADGPAPVAAANGEAAAGDLAAIRAAAAAYREALAMGDTAAIRRAWTADGDVVDGWGNLFSAADVADAGTGQAGTAKPEIRIGQSRLRLVTPDVAIEDGEVDVVIPGTTTPLEGWFSAVWVKQAGAWKLSSIREAERPTTVKADVIDDLDWMVGSWTLVPEDGGAKDSVPEMEMTVRWDAGRMFLVRDVRLSSPASGGERLTLDVQQRIGWDPLVGRIRSWSFATDGTRGEATWLRDGTSWIVKSTSIQADGTQSSAVHIYTYDGKDRCQWRTLVEPFAGGEREPVRATWVRGPQEGVK